MGKKTEDPPVEPPGLRSDLFEDPDDSAVAAALHATATPTSAVASSGGGGAADHGDEDPPREGDLGIAPAPGATDEVENPPQEWDP